MVKFFYQLMVMGQLHKTLSVYHIKIICTLTVTVHRIQKHSYIY